MALGCAAPPRPDGFYIAPKRKKSAVSEERESVRRRRPGDLLRSEPMTPPLPGTAAWKILYASTGLDGEIIEVSGVVIAPTRQAPIHGRNVVAWAHPTTGVARNCAPSILKGVFDTIPHLPALMALDDVVVATDYPGLGTSGPHPYLVGLSEGRAVLDSVRAAQQVEKVGANSRCAVWGHSQGGHAALFAGQLAKSYAPDLTLVGVAAIAPATDLEQLLKDDQDERAGKVIVSYCVWSWSRVYGIPIEDWVAAGVVPAIDRVAGDCIESEGEAYGALIATFPIPSNYLSPDVFTQRTVAPFAGGESARQRPGGRAALRRAGDSDDPIVRPTVTADFVAGLCRAGETVRYETFPGVAHMKAGRISASSAIQWMQSRFDGTRAPNTCPPM